MLLPCRAGSVSPIGLGGADIRIMPTSTESRIVADRIVADFPSDDTSGIGITEEC